MKINLELHLKFEGTGSLHFDHPVVNARYFREDPHKEAARWAYKRFKAILREHGYIDLVIDKIIYNREHDITDLVQEMVNAPIDTQVEWALNGYI